MPQWLWLTDKCKPLKAWGQIVRGELPIILCHSLGVVLTSPNQEDGCKDAHHLYWTAGCSKGWKQGGAKIQGQLNFRVFPNITERNSCFYSNARSRLMPPPAVTKAGTQSLFQIVTWPAKSQGSVVIILKGENVLDTSIECILVQLFSYFLIFLRRSRVIEYMGSIEIRERRGETDNGLCRQTLGQMLCWWLENLIYFKASPTPHPQVFTYLIPRDELSKKVAY